MGLTAFIVSETFNNRRALKKLSPNQRYFQLKDKKKNIRKNIEK